MLITYFHWLNGLFACCIVLGGPSVPLNALFKEFVFAPNTNLGKHQAVCFGILYSAYSVVQNPCQVLFMVGNLQNKSVWVKWTSSTCSSLINIMVLLSKALNLPTVQVQYRELWSYWEASRSEYFQLCDQDIPDKDRFPSNETYFINSKKKWCYLYFYSVVFCFNKHLLKC